jgi:hypothetical protein
VRLIEDVDLAGLALCGLMQVSEVVQLMQCRPTSNWPASSPRVLDGRQISFDAGGDAKPIQMHLPRRLINEIGIGRHGQPGDNRPGGVPAHTGQRRSVDHVVGVTATQQIQESQPALAGGGTEPGNVIVGNLRAGAVGCPMPYVSIINAYPRRLRQTDPQHVPGFVEEAVLACNQQPHQPTAGDETLRIMRQGIGLSKVRGPPSFRRMRCSPDLGCNSDLPLRPLSMTRLAEAFLGWYDGRASIVSTNPIAKHADSFRTGPPVVPDFMPPIWFFGDDRHDRAYCEAGPGSPDR